VTVTAFSRPAFAAIARLITERTGLSFTSHRCRDAELGIRRAMARRHVLDPDAYLPRLERHDAWLDDLVAELTVGETYFFREPAQFAWLREQVLPDVVRRRGPEASLRIWSAGCASGEEAYSLAMTAQDAGLGGRVTVLGTDISRPALARAQHAVYRPWSLRGLDDATRERHFHRVEKGWQVDQRIRELVTFAPHNLASDGRGAPADVDVVFCRNVLIYFDGDTVRRVLRGLLSSLVEGGWLVLASSDPRLEPDDTVEAVTMSSGVCYRKSSARRVAVPAAPPPRIRPVAPSAEPAPEPTVDSPRTRDRGRDDQHASSAVARIRALAHAGGRDAAVREAERAVRADPLVCDVHVLCATLLLDGRRDDEAIRYLKRALYLDPSLVIAHFLLGAALGRRGDVDGARRAFRNARDLAAALPADHPVALGDGEPAARVAAAAAAEIARLERTGPVTP
jgi:chemotaxis protein methyltransferase CheR